MVTGVHLDEQILVLHGLRTWASHRACEIPAKGGRYDAYGGPTVSGSESDRQTVGTEEAEKRKHILSRTLSIHVTGRGQHIPHAGL